MRRRFTSTLPIRLSTWIGLFVVISSIPSVTNAQGCSDGGLCTIAELEPGMMIEETSSPIRLNAGASYGSGQYGLQVVTPSVGVTMRAKEQFGLDFKLTFATINGELGSNSGLGDFYSTLSWHPTGFSAGYSVFLGLKQPLSSSNAKIDGSPLPMEYQTSLGTTDLLAGASWKIGRYEVGIGWQRSMQEHNDNQFISGPLPGVEAKKYPTTYHYSRNGDVLMRLAATYRLLNGRVHLTPSLLPIYHYANDTSGPPNSEEVTLDGSKDWTINLNVYGSWKWRETTTIGASFGAPMVARSARPDGLTREFVLGLHVIIAL